MFSSTGGTGYIGKRHIKPCNWMVNILSRPTGSEAKIQQVVRW